MKKNLMRIPVQFFVLFIGLFAVSCNTDDGKDVIPSVSSNTEYNGSKYTIKSGMYQDNGATPIFNDNNTHYNSNFFLTDGTPVFDNTGKVEKVNNGKIAIFTSLMSPGTTGFKTGTFEYMNFLDDMDLEDDELETKYKDKYFFPLAYVFIDTDGDNNWEEENELEVSGGTFKITGTASKYNTEYDLNLKNGKKIKGSYSGTFTKIELDEDDDE